MRTALLLTLLVPSAAFAHKMEVAAAIPPAAPTTIRVEAGYEGDEPAQQAAVTLLDAAGGVTASGTTDDRGVCTLPRPRGGTYTVRVDDGSGHRAEVALTVPEVEAEVAEARTERRSRWGMAGVGLGLIGGLTVVARRLLRKPG
jgi:hypothetical protein